MIQESFEVEVKKGSKFISNYNVEEDRGSDITDDDLDNLSTDDEQQNEFLNYLIEAFSLVATVEPLNYNEFEISFHNPNVTLVDEDNNYDFDIIEDIPILDDVSLFIPFVNFIKNNEPGLTGIALYTNLEGGGSLII